MSNLLLEFIEIRKISFKKGRKFHVTKYLFRLQNMGLRQELDRLKNENMLLRDKLSKYTEV